MEWWSRCCLSSWPRFFPLEIPGDAWHRRLRARCRWGHVTSASGTNWTPRVSSGTRSWVTGMWMSTMSWTQSMTHSDKLRSSWWEYKISFLVQLINYHIFSLTHIAGRWPWHLCPPPRVTRAPCSPSTTHWSAPSPTSSWWRWTGSRPGVSSVSGALKCGQSPAYKRGQHSIAPSQALLKLLMIMQVNRPLGGVALHVYEQYYFGNWISTNCEPESHGGAGHAHPAIP